VVLSIVIHGAMLVACASRSSVSAWRAMPTRHMGRWGLVLHRQSANGHSTAFDQPIIQQTAAFVDVPTAPLLLAFTAVGANEPTASQQETPIAPEIFFWHTDEWRENSAEASEAKRQSQRRPRLRQAFTVIRHERLWPRPASSASRAK